MDTQETRSSAAEVTRSIAYIVLPTIIVSCLAYALFIDQSGKSIGALGAAFASFIGLIVALGHSRSSKVRSTFDEHRPRINPASGLPMIDGVVDSGGNAYGSTRRHD